MRQELTPFLFLLLVTGHAHAQIYPWSGLVGKRLVNGLPVGAMYGNDTNWAQCVRECYFRTRCTAVNFQLTGVPPRGLVCQHIAVVPGDETYADDVDYLTGSVAMWNGEFAGTCASRPCNINEKCLPAEPNYVCLPWCDMISTVPLHSEGVDSGWGLNSWLIGGPLGFVLRRRGCRTQYMLPPGGLTATCQPDGTWSRNTQDWECLEITDCLAIKQCNAEYTDGAYSIIESGDVISVTCSDMASASPTTNFTVAPGASVIIPEC